MGDQRDEWGIPRRNRVDQNTPAELAIQAAVDEVEKVGADPILTEVVIALGKARERLADYVDRTQAHVLPGVFDGDPAAKVTRLNAVAFVQKATRAELDAWKPCGCDGCVYCTNVIGAAKARELWEKA